MQEPKGSSYRAADDMDGTSIADKINIFNYDNFIN